MRTCEECGFIGEFVTENYGSNVITFCPDCYKSKSDVCTHGKFVLVKYLQNNNPVVRQMCSSCFEMFGSFVKQSGLDISKIKIIEKGLYDKYIEDNHRKYSERYSKLNQYYQEWRKTVWLKYHNDYLNSVQWKEKRDQVLKRDNYLCQACRKNRATQVHHLSYDHWMHEPLFELVSICQNCHERITEMDRNKKEQS